MDQGYRKYGIEINQSAAAVAVSQSGAVVWPSTNAIPAELRFDVIVLADVIEHVDDPKQLITTLAAILAKDGILIITTGDAGSRLWEMFGANWWYCVFPEHITFISRPWLHYLSESTQLVVMHCENFFYCNLSNARKLLDGFLMVFYGFAPWLYLGLGRLVKATLRRRGDVPVRGVGLSADHLFVVLANRGS
jgi:SAM-dependent methyltransferase